MRNLDIIALAGTGLLSSLCTDAAVDQGNTRPGLAGMTYNSEDFTQPDETDVLLGVGNDWGASRGNDWSASWYGLIEGPFDGAVEFSAEVNDGIRLRIGDADVFDGLNADGARGGSVLMVKGAKVRSESILRPGVDRPSLSSPGNGMAQTGRLFRQVH